MSKDEKLSFDSECLVLADHFLHDEWPTSTDDERNSLARAIQSAVEDWFFAREMATATVSEDNTEKRGDEVLPAQEERVKGSTDAHEG